MITIDSRSGGGPVPITGGGLCTGGLDVITIESRGGRGVCSGGWVTMMVEKSSRMGGGVTGWMIGSGVGVTVGVVTPESESPCLTLTQRTWPILQAVWYP